MQRIDEPIRVAFDEGMTEIHYGLTAIDAKVWRGSRVRPRMVVLEPSQPWSAEVSDVFRAAARARLDGEIAILRQYHDEARIRSELELDLLEPMLAG